MKHKLLLVEDDAALGYLLKEYLTMKDFDLEWAKNGMAALELIEQKRFDLAILDVMMPEMDGFHLAKEIKQNHPNLPFLFLTARSMKIDVLKGFSLGAVDYLKKPIDEEELVVRLRVLLENLKRDSALEEGQSLDRVELGTYRFDPKSQVLYFEGEMHKQLTKREGEVLMTLYQGRNTLCSHKDILLRHWGKNDFFAKKSLNVFVSHLRKYLAEDPNIRIENRHNQGFILHLND